MQHSHPFNYNKLINCGLYHKAVWYKSLNASKIATLKKYYFDFSASFFYKTIQSIKLASSHNWQCFKSLKAVHRVSNRRSLEIQGTALSKCLWHGPVYIGPCLRVQCRVSTLLLGGTVSMLGRSQIPVNKGRKGIRNANQALAVREEHADQIVGSPNW